MNPHRDVFVGDVVIEGGRIVALLVESQAESRADAGVGPGAASSVDQGPRALRDHDEVVDCTGKLVIPGLVQPHVHLCQTLFRGRADGLMLLDWLRNRVWPHEAAHTHASLHASSVLGALELLRSGTTSILDMGTVHHTEAIFEACARTGLRATIGKAMMDVDQGQPSELLESTESSLEESVRLFEVWHGAAAGRLRYAFAPRFALSCSEELLRRTAAEARDRELIFHTHASENPDEVALVRACRGMDNVAYLHSLGGVGPRTVLAHCVWLTLEEEEILRRTGAHVVHCPSSNLKLGSGVLPLPELLERGVNVGLAADGAPCANNLDAFVEMRLAGLIHNVRFGPGRLSAERVFEMATLGGARALGLDREVGSLEVGKRADVVAVETGRLHVCPTADPYGMLVYSLHGSDVRHVLVDGAWVLRDGEFVGLDVGRVVEEADAAARALFQRIGRVGSSDDGG